MSSSGAKTGSGTISDLTTSGKPLLTITNPAGPTTNLAVGAYAPGVSVESYIAATVALAAAVVTEVASVLLGAGTWLVTARLVNQSAATTPTAWESWIGPNAASETGAYAGSFTAVGSLAGGQIDSQHTLVKVVTLATSGTVYLNTVQATSTGTIQFTTPSGAPSATGITAVRIA